MKTKPRHSTLLPITWYAWTYSIYARCCSTHANTYQCLIARYFVYLYMQNENTTEQHLSTKLKSQNINVICSKISMCVCVWVCGCVPLTNFPIKMVKISTKTDRSNYAVAGWKAFQPLKRLKALDSLHEFHATQLN